MIAPRKSTPPLAGVFRRFRVLAVSALCAAPLSLLAQSYTQSFSSAPSNWQQVSGSWTTSGGFYNQASNGFPMVSVYNGANWSDFTYRTRMKNSWTSTGNRVGVVFNYQNSTNYYIVDVNAAGLVELRNYTGSGYGDPVASGIFTGGSLANVWFDLEVVRTGKNTTVRITLGSTTQTVIDSALQPEWTTGKIGLITRNTQGGQFDHLTVGAPRFIPGITEPFGSGPSYTPTRYVDFLHQQANDNNIGDNPNFPWKHAPGMVAGGPSAAPGMVIALKRGQVWRLTSPWVIPSSGNTTAGPIVYTAYGSASDPLPRVTVLEDLRGTVSTWTNLGGGIYSRPVTGIVERLYVNGVGLGEAAATTSGPKNWVGQNHIVTAIKVPTPNPFGISIGTDYDTGIVKKWKQTGGANGTLYLYSPTASPHTLASVEGLRGESTAPRFAVTCVDKSHVYLDRIAFHGGWERVVNIIATAGATPAPTNVRVTNCEVKYAQQKGIYVSSDSTVGSGFTAGQIKWNRVDSGDGPETPVMHRNAWYGGDNGSPVPDYLQPYPGEDLGKNDGISLWNGVQNWTIAQNDVSNFWHTNLKVDRITVSTSVRDTTGNIIEHNNSHSENITYSHGISIGCKGLESVSYRTHNNTARFNHIYDTWSGSALKGRNQKFYGNLVVGVYGSPKEPANNVSWTGDGIQVNGFDDPATTGAGQVISDGVIAYNTFVNCSGAAVGMLNLQIEGTSILGRAPKDFIVANNIMAYCGYRRYMATNPWNPFFIAFRDKDDARSIIDVDNNVMYSPLAPSGQVYEYLGTSSRIDVPTMQNLDNSPHQWQQNLALDPKFANYVESYPDSYFVAGSRESYQLQVTSPARGAARTNLAAVLGEPDAVNWLDVGCWQVP